MCKIDYDESLNEIHEIRHKQYEETKNMTTEERMRYTRTKSERVRKEIEKIKAEKRDKKSA